MAKDSALYLLLAGHFHQDWVDDYASSDGAVKDSSMTNAKITSSSQLRSTHCFART